MKQLAFALYDSKAKYFTPPFFCANEMVAQRMVMGLCQDPKSMVGQFPNDWTLFQIGTYDDEKAELVACSPLVNVGIVAQFARPAILQAIATEKEAGNVR